MKQQNKTFKDYVKVVLANVMKSYDKLKPEMKAIQHQMAETKKNERMNSRK